MLWHFKLICLDISYTYVLLHCLLFTILYVMFGFSNFNDNFLHVSKWWWCKFKTTINGLCYDGYVLYYNFHSNYFEIILYNSFYKLIYLGIFKFFLCVCKFRFYLFFFCKLYNWKCYIQFFFANAEKWSMNKEGW